MNRPRLFLRRALCSLVVLIALWAHAATAAPFSSETHDVYTGDFNGDGKSDLLVIAKDPAGVSGIYVTDSSGAPSTQLQSWSSGFLGINWFGSRYTAVIGNFDGVNGDDVLLQSNGSGTSFLLPTNAQGQLYGIGQYLGGWGTDAYRIVAGKFDSNARADVFLQARQPTGTSSVVLSDGAGHLTITNQTWANDHLGFKWSVANAIVYAGDFNGDGRDDLLVQAKAEIALIDYDIPIPVPVYRNNAFGITLATAAGQFTSIHDVFSRKELGADFAPTESDIVIGDFNSDGRDDILLLAKKTGQSSVVVLTDGNGQLTSATTVSVPPGTLGAELRSLLADFNGDGRSELYRVAASSGGSNTIVSFTSSGSIAATVAHNPPPISNNMGTLVGRLPGEFGVDNNGAATYEIPIDVPEGTNGLKPDLALVYNSMADGGGLGAGWSLSGFSAITRCPSTLDQDGAVRGVELSANDRFCLDGNKLRTTNGGGYGANGTTYQTEVETLSRVTSYTGGGGGYVPSSGPQYFRVESKDGLYLYYGSTEDARVEVTGTYIPKVWALNRIEDRSGNYLTITYSKQSGSFRPAQVDWARTAAGTGPFFRAVFVYESRPASDIDSGYFAGGYFVDSARLDRLEVQQLTAGSWTLVRQYDVAYEPSVSSTGKGRVASITQCSATACLPATTFQYQNGAVGWSGIDVTSSAASTASMDYASAIDFDGDGFTDLIYPQAGTWWYMRANGAGGYAGPQNTNVSAAAPFVARPIRMASNGATGLMIYTGTSSSPLILGWNGSAVAAVLSTNLAATAFNGLQWIVDFDGDGLDDLGYTQANNGVYDVLYRRNLGVSGGVQTFDSTPQTLMSGMAQNVLTTAVPQYDVSTQDFNGDGKADIFYQSGIPQDCVPDGFGVNCNYPATYSNVLLSTPAGLVNAGGWSCNTFCAPTVVGDFNGDGQVDFIYVDLGAPDSNGGFRLRFGTGTGLAGPIQIDVPPVANITVVDYDNDGRADLLVPGCGGRCLYRSTGAGFEAGIASGIPEGDAGTMRVLDLDGNGLSDIGYKSGGIWRVRLFNGAAPDLLTRATDGFGNFIAPSYAPLTNSTIYTKGTGAAYPTTDVQGPMYVVSSYQSNSGIANPATYSVSYKYQGARVNMRGRGLLGFAQRTRTDNRPGNQLITVENYRQDFPYIGNIASSVVYQPDGVTKISQIDNTYDVKLLDATPGNSRILPYNRTITERKYEVGGPNNGELVTSSLTTNTIDNFGNLTLQEVAATDEFASSPLRGSVYRSFSDNTYAPNTTTWCLGVVQTARVKSQPAGAITPTTRTKSFQVDDTKCRATQETIEPDSTTLKVTTDIAYFQSGPSAGQISSRKVTGINMQPRTTSYEYHPAGPLVTKTTDALGHTNQSEWNAGLEFETARIDVNGKRVEYGSDSIGRKTSELRPDGTRVDIRYYACATGCGLATGKFQIVTTSSAQGVLIEQGATIHDALGRTLQSTQWLLGGAQSHVLTEYDVMGRPTRKSAPFFTGAPVYWATTSYDLVGRPLSEQRQVSETDSSIQTISWSHEGLRMRQSDANGKVITKRSDAIGRVVQMTDAAGTHTWYEYDPFGNALRTYVGDSSGVPSAGTVIVNQFDLRGHKTRSDDPDMGVWTYVYNALDELESQTDAKSQTITQSYDLLGRLISRQELEGTSTWTYDTAANGIGLLATVTSPGGYSETHGYDFLGRQSTETTTIDGVQYLVTAAYNALGQVETIEYPQSYPTNYRFKVRFAYDYGLLKRVEDATGSGTVYWQANDTDAAGEVITEQLGNGIGTSSWFDNVSGVLRQRTSGPGYSGSVQSLQYQWDRQGNLTQRRDNNQNTTENFVYDSLYRLDYSTLTTGGTTVTNLDVSYDAIGNITSMTGNGTYTYHPTKKHAVVSTSSGQTFGYDANGNMINRNGSAIDWYSYNLPKKLRDGTDSAEFFYNADRDRYKQIAISAEGTETTTYIGSLMERVVKPNGVIEFKHNIPGADGGAAIYTRRSNGAYDTRYLTTDHLGSVDTITNEAGTVLARLNYDAFGKRRGVLANDMTVINAVTHIGFTGQETLDNIDLVHMNGRVYDPLTGRFISADPFVQDPLNSQSLNRYSYVANNPLSLIDPSGFSFISKIGKSVKKAFKGVAGVVAGIVGVVVGVVTTAGCLAATNGIGSGGCVAAGISAGTQAYGLTRIALGNAINISTRGPPTSGGGSSSSPGTGSLLDAPPGPSLPPGTIVFLGAPTSVVEVTQSQSEDTLGSVLLDVGIDLVKNGIIPFDAIRVIFNPNSTWAEIAEAAFEIGLAVSPGKVLTLVKRFAVAYRRFRAFRVNSAAKVVCLLCFAAGTEVATADGQRPIETLQIGDYVLAANEGTGELTYRPIVHVFVNPDQPVFELVIADANGVSETQYVTKNHPYWVDGKGWIPVSQLQAGMRLRSESTDPLQLLSVRVTDRIETTYNLEVADLHTFFVGHHRALVHNAGRDCINGTVDATKRLSQFLRNKLKRIRNQGAAGGNRGVTGAVSESEARELGKTFVGPRSRLMSNGKGLVSEDELRTFRFPENKGGINPNTSEPFSKTGRQANFETFDPSDGSRLSNVHLDVY